MMSKTPTISSDALPALTRNQTCSELSINILIKPLQGPFLGDLLVTGWSKWLHNEPATYSNFPPLYNNLIFRQTRIGWKQLFLGRFVLEWSDLQQNHLVLQNITSKKYSGTSWITGVTQIIWHHVYSNWEARNSDLHSIDATMREQAQYAQAQRETEEI